MSHYLKLLLEIINSSIKRILDEQFEGDSILFCGKEGNPDTIVLVKVVIQRALLVKRTLSCASLIMKKHSIDLTAEQLD